MHVAQQRMAESATQRCPPAAATSLLALLSTLCQVAGASMAELMATFCDNLLKKVGRPGVVGFGMIAKGHWLSSERQFVGRQWQPDPVPAWRSACNAPHCPACLEF